MAQILVDTDILIDVANNDAIAVERLANESRSSTLAVSSITVMELTVGCRNKTELQALNRFLAQFQVLTLTTQSSEIATQLLQEYFLSHGLLIADALIAATAISNQISLLSKNQSDFRFIQQLNLMPYP
ncbi:type II toxin-antitoxin system VapC family toxin [Leptolyngbya iicbica]|jgi:predicted nucleic acid-binding protein|uniref:Type II toxin-antitoxin system VapC family toxin n=2 Tax=Cyanophyceae TaxID=3028117 RepID=A0A4Q7E8I6_9CYAN|nr:type II toxin-antitoxin system VapC family toxin [Leptolyngbya sp. LK]RZM79127.1 type II toxin-antitoxin system VapC family toxin [Leptolyngbya sp. LK]